MQPKDALNQILSSRGQILDIGFPDTQEKVCQIKLILNNMRGLVTSSTLKNNERDTDHRVLLNLILQHHFLDCHFKIIHADSRDTYWKAFTAGLEEDINGFRRVLSLNCGSISS